MDQVEIVPTENREDTSTVNSFYKILRPLAVTSKICGSFPLKHVLKQDGREIKHSWLSPIQLWDILFCILVILLFMDSCAKMQSKLGEEEEQTRLLIWLTLTFFIVTIRCCALFIIVHIYAPRIPALLTAIEKYHQVTGTSIIQADKHPLLTQLFPLLRTLVILIILTMISFLFFDQIDGADVMFESWPITLPFLFANIWKELPMNVFAVMCRYLTIRFSEIRDETRRVRERAEKDAAGNIEQLRLQYTALLKILSHVEDCFGMQLAVNLFFLFLDTVLQFYVYFVITASETAMLLLLAVYYFFMAVMMLIIVQRMESMGPSILREITAFELCTANQGQQAQIQLFAMQLSVQPIKLSASNFFTINNSLICSLLGALATYIVMLVQFKPYISLHLGNFTLPSII